jgi:splicing factor 3B subunit 3
MLYEWFISNYCLYSILALDKLGTVFNQASIPLNYTPRRFTVHPGSRNFVVIETEHGVYSPAERERIINEKVSDDLFYN